MSRYMESIWAKILELKSDEKLRFIGPKELEHITGLSPEFQRVWRMRGHLPAYGREHAKFTIEQAAMIAIAVQLKDISCAGLPNILLAARQHADTLLDITARKGYLVVTSNEIKWITTPFDISEFTTVGIINMERLGAEFDRRIMEIAVRTF